MEVEMIDSKKHCNTMQYSLAKNEGLDSPRDLEIKNEGWFDRTLEERAGNGEITGRFQCTHALSVFRSKG
jgi:hypothetical protein